jgi:transposase
VHGRRGGRERTGLWTGVAPLLAGHPWRSVSEAGHGTFRLTLASKAEYRGTRLVVVDRFFGSSKIHHCCGGELVAATKLAKQLTCLRCSDVVDRDDNAAKNLRDWPEIPIAPTALAQLGPAPRSDPGHR